MAWIAILILVMVDMSICKNVNTFQDQFSEIKTELANLKHRVNDLERSNKDQIKKTSNLERENQAKTTTILHLESELNSVKQLTADLMAKHEGSDIITGKRENIPERAGGTRESEGDNKPNVQKHNVVFDIASSLNEPTIDSRKQDGSPKNVEATPHEESNRLAERVAFTAMGSPHYYGPLGHNQVIQFDSVVTNNGNAYNRNSGTFVAPVDGVYMFFATITGSSENTATGYVQFMLNGNLVNKLIVSHLEQSSQMLILNLRANDRVSLVNGAENDTLLGVTYTSFSGLLLYA